MNNQCSCHSPFTCDYIMKDKDRASDESCEHCQPEQEVDRESIEGRLDSEPVQTWEGEFDIKFHPSISQLGVQENNVTISQVDELKDFIAKEKAKSHALGYRTGMEDGRLLEKTMNEANGYKEKLTEK